MPDGLCPIRRPLPGALRRALAQGVSASMGLAFCCLLGSLKACLSRSP